MDDFHKRLRHRVQLAKEVKGWTDADFGRALGMSRTRFNNWLNTERKPSLQFLSLICEITETNPAYFLGMTDDPTWPPQSSDISRIEQKLDRLLKSNK